MPIKKPNKDAAYVSLGEKRKQTGRPPNCPEKLDARLQQLIRQSETWSRLVREAWFDPGDPILELAQGATELECLVEQYDEAIEIVQWVGAYAKVAEEKLLIGRRNAIKKGKEAEELRAAKPAPDTPKQS